MELFLLWTGITVWSLIGLAIFYLLFDFIRIAIRVLFVWNDAVRWLHDNSHKKRRWFFSRLWYFLRGWMLWTWNGPPASIRMRNAAGEVLYWHNPRKSEEEL